MGRKILGIFFGRIIGVTVIGIIEINTDNCLTIIVYKKNCSFIMQRILPDGE